MKESTIQAPEAIPAVQQPWGTLSGMLAACIIVLWCVAHDHPIDEILARSLIGALATGCLVRACTLTWSVFFTEQRAGSKEHGARR